MSKKTSMYDWNIAMQQKGLSKLAKEFTINRMQDDDRLEKSGLPFFHKFVTDYDSFSRENKELIEFIDTYKEFIVRVLPIPEEKKLPRRFKRGEIYTFEHCKNFIDELFEKDKELKGKEKFYRISLSETEVNKLGGVIISNIKGIRTEVKRERKKRNEDKKIGGLTGLCYGENPDLGCIIDLTGIGHVTDKTFWTKPGLGWVSDLTGIGHVTDKTFWTKQNLKLSRVILKAIDYLKISGKDDNFNPHFIKGYFEFLQTKSDRIIFWDYKIQEFFQV